MSNNLSVENDSNDNEFILKSIMNDYNNNNSNANSITDDHTDLDDLTTLTNATPLINKIQIQKSQPQQQNSTPSTEINNNINVYIENHVMKNNLKKLT